MTNISLFFLSENLKFLEVKFSIYLNRHVFVMSCMGWLMMESFSFKSIVPRTSGPMKGSYEIGVFFRSGPLSEWKQNQI